jgi:hypothetical protein
VWYAGVAANACGFLVLAWLTWGKWTDVTIDFGRELYVPWQMSEGKVLYQDIAYRNGPLSQLWNSFLFRTFGVSLRTLVWFNLALLAVICGLLFRLFRIACGSVTATLVCLYFITVFAFGQYTGIANYNYVTPYQHYQTHGVFLTLLMINAFVAALDRRLLLNTATAGFLLGLLFLTKVELFAPAAAAAGAGFAVLMIGGALRKLAAIALFACFALIPVLAAFALLSTQMDASDAWTGVLGNWPHLGTALGGDPFYIRRAGFDDPTGHTLRAISRLLAIVVFACGLVALDRWVPIRTQARPRVALVSGLVILLGIVFGPSFISWHELARALPLTSVVLVVALAATLWRHRHNPDAVRRTAPLLMIGVWGLILIGKIILNAQIRHYGFVLAMPATLLLIAGTLELYRVRKSSGGGQIIRAVSLALVAGSACYFLQDSLAHYAVRDFPVGDGGDRILVARPEVSRRGLIVSNALTLLEEWLPEDGTLLVLPEGTSINYWLRRENPIRFDLFLPTELRAFGGDRVVIRELDANPPSMIALVHRDHREFGVEPFGVDPRNGRDLMRWVKQNYTSLGDIGPEPFTSRLFGITILRRNSLGS